MRVSYEVQEVLNLAYKYAREKKHEYLTPEHILYSALLFDIARDILKICGADPERLKVSLEKHLEKHVPAAKNAEPVQSVSFESVIERAVFHTESSQKGEIDMGDLLVSIFDEEKSHGSFFLKKEGIQRVELLEAISHGPLKVDKFDQTVTEEGKKKKESFLERFTSELVNLAREDKLDPFIGRQEILERTMQVLSRRIKNNPVLVGEAGVGKTAIAEGLAQRIAAGDVPELLRDFKIYSLDMGSLIAGTRYRGDFEERLKKVLAEVAAQSKAILFIDEIHTVVGTGYASGGSMDASSLLKPALISGNMRCMGSTTYDEYKKHFDRDHALSRRFQMIEVPEASRMETIAILKGLKARYEEYHKVVYTPEALEAAVNLSGQYINERYLPDKAIDVIDEAGAYYRISQFKELRLNQSPASGETEPSANNIIALDLIEKVVAKIAKIPEKSVSVSEVIRLKNLETELRERIFGQNEAIENVVKAVKRSRAGFHNPDKPVASFLFVGPTGVGKTELCRQLADILGITLHRFDMSEYQEQHTVSRLIGSPPGYVGYDEGGLLTDAIRKTPHAVLLLDEIEKAHQDVFNVLLQVLDYATLTDNAGRRADFRNVIVIMTSNAGARDIGHAVVGFGDDKTPDAAVSKAVERVFSPEFRNRLDSIITFNNLDEKNILEIVDKELRFFQGQLDEKKIILEVTDACRQWLAQRGYSREFGARNISRLVQEKIKAFFVDAVLFGTLQQGGKAVADIEADDVVIRT